ncbi:22996_t:CDS:1, partial [Gigaspora rosea]
DLDLLQTIIFDDFFTHSNPNNNSLTMTETDLTTEYTDLTLIISYHQQIFQQINQ